MSHVRICAALLAAASLVTAASASAAGGGAAPVTVKGTQTIVNEAKGKFAVQGDLLGTWDVTAFTTHYQGRTGSSSGAARSSSAAAGTSTGTAPATRASRRARSASQFKPSTTTLIKGQCVHPVLGGTGGFAGITGIVHMVDRPTAGGVKTTYRGTLTYPGSATASTSALATRELAGRVAPASCGG